MKRLNERDYDLLELLQSAPTSLKFGEIVEKSGKGVAEVHKGLIKLQKRNYIAVDGDSGANYRITDNNEKVIIRKVQCPICKTSKRVYAESQESTICNNPECTNRGGLRRQFWIISRPMRVGGIVKRINLAE